MGIFSINESWTIEIFSSSRLYIDLVALLLYSLFFFEIKWLYL